VCGMMNEHVSCETENSGLFSAIAADGTVKAVFAGHDHTNDFCAGPLEGVQLCYEGSPGYQGYGCCFEAGPSKGACLARRARVTEVSGFGAAVRSWKRVDAQPYPSEVLIDSQTLWSSSGSGGGGGSGGLGAVGECPSEAPLFRTRAEAAAALPALSQK